MGKNRRWVVVELRARPVNVTGMKEPQKAVVGAVERAADERGDVRRTQEAVTRKLAHNVHVVISETEGRRLRRTAEPRPAGRGDMRLRVHAYNYIGADGVGSVGVWGKGTAIGLPNFGSCSQGFQGPDQRGIFGY